MSHAPTLIEIASCASTQDEARARLEAVAPGGLLAVSARRQTSGVGRQGRAWHNPPGEAVLVSIARQGPAPSHLLLDLAERTMAAVRAAIELQIPTAAHVLSWKAPNDLVARADGAKVAGLLIDARSTGSTVDQLIIGIGVNVTGPPFTTSDHRGATSLAASCGAPDVDRNTLLHDIVSQVSQLVQTT